MKHPILSPDRPMGVLMIVQMASQLVYLYLGTALAGWISIALVLVMPVLGWRSLKMREFYLLAVCFGLLVPIAAGRSDAADIVHTGLDRAAYLASFILLMGFLRDGAVTSPSILAFGRYITRQPPKRRFAAIFSGSHFLSVMINLGSMSLLAPIIQRGIRGDDREFADLDNIQRVREQRQLSAALRGFGWFLVWAPTSITQAVLPTLIPGVDPFRLIGLGLMITAIMLALGWLEDTFRWLPLRRRLAAAGMSPPVEKSSAPWAAIGKLAIVCGSLFALTFLFLRLASVTVVTGVMLAAPIVVIVWIRQQQSAAGADESAFGRRMEVSAFVNMPGFVREAIFIASAGFIGTLAAALVPAEEFAAAIELGSLPDWIVLAALSFSVLAAAQIGMSPITMAVFLGSVYSHLPFSPVEPTLAALAIAAGTAIASTGAPFASAVVMLARVSGHDGTTLTWRWNGVFTVLSMGLLVLIYMAMTR